jgi:DNA replication protein DnaC
MSSLNPNPNPNDLTRKLFRLGFYALSAGLDDFVARAIKGRWDPRTLLEEMAALEEVEKARRSLQRRLRTARIGRFKPMADFDWSWPQKIDRPLIERAFTLDFIGENRNLILLGANGLGKTMITKNIAHAAVLAGFSVLFRTASDLLDDLQSDSPLLLRRRLKKYAAPALLCIDEIGYLSYDSHAADLLYEVVNRRYEERSILVTTNRGFRDWNAVFPNATSIVSLIDRLTHRADVTVIEGQSYRRRESEQEAAQRRRQTKANS